MRRGEILTKEVVLEYHCYLHYTENFDRDIVEISPVLVTEDDLSHKMDIGVSVGLGGLLGGLGVKIPVGGPLGAVGEERVEVEVDEALMGRDLEV